MKAHTKQKIIDATIALISEKGFNISLREIGVRAEVSHAAISKGFGNKMGLLYNAIAFAQCRFLELVGPEVKDETLGVLLLRIWSTLERYPESMHLITVLAVGSKTGQIDLEQIRPYLKHYSSESSMSTPTIPHRILRACERHQKTTAAVPHTTALQLSTALITLVYGMSSYSSLLQFAYNQSDAENRASSLGIVNALLTLLNIEKQPVRSEDFKNNT